MKLKMWFRRFFKRITVRFYRWERNHSLFQTSEEVTEYESTCMSICRQVMKNESSKFSIAPLSEKKYVINESLGVFIVIQDNKIEITNHVYHYEVKLQNRQAKRIHSMFNKKTEKIRLDYENQIKSQISNSLEQILNKVKP